jgi:hypothetical protein
MSALEQAVVGPAIEVVAKATRRRFTVEYKRKIVREADACKAAGCYGLSAWARCRCAGSASRPSERPLGQ